MSIEAQERSLSKRAFPNWWIWAIWLAGPVSYGLAFIIYVVIPELYYGSSDPGPDLGLGCLMVLTHGAAGVGTLPLLFTRGQHWRRPEFWLLVIYWVGIAGWLSPALLAVTLDAAISPTLPWCCTRVSLVAVVLMPLVGVVRWLAGRARRRATSER